MGEFDEVAGASAEELAARTEQVRVEAVRRSRSRAEAIVSAAILADEVSARKGEREPDRSQRVARAQAYAAWEWDGKPAGGAHLAEFGVTNTTTPPEVRNGSDWKPEGKKR